MADTPDHDYKGNQKKTEGHSYDEIVNKFNKRHENHDGKICVAQIVSVNIEERMCDLKVGEKRYVDATWLMPTFTARTGNGMDFIPEVNQRVVAFITGGTALVLGSIPQREPPRKKESTTNFKKNRNPNLETSDFMYQMNEDLQSHIWLKAAGVLELFAEAWTFLNIDGLEHLIEQYADNFTLHNNNSGSWQWITEIARFGDEEKSGNSYMKMEMKGNVREERNIIEYVVGKENKNDDSKVRVRVNETDERNKENPMEVHVEGDATFSCDSNVEITTTGKDLDRDSGKPGHITLRTQQEQANINIVREGKEGEIKIENKAEKSPVNVIQQAAESPVSVDTVAEKSPITLSTQGSESPINIESKSSKSPINIESKGSQSTITIDAQGGQSNVDITSGKASITATAKKNVEITSTAQTKITAQAGLSITSNATTSITSAGPTTITSQAPTTITSQAPLAINSQAPMSLQSSATASITAGGPVSVTGGGPVSIKGAVVTLSAPLTIG